MTCTWVKNQLSGFLDDELPEDERQAVLNHLKRCRECERELAKIRRLKDMLGTFTRDVPEEVRRSMVPTLESLRFGLLVSRIRECAFILVATLGVMAIFLLMLPRYQAAREITTRFIEPYENLHRSVSGQQFEPLRSSSSFEITPVDYLFSPAETTPGED